MKPKKKSNWEDLRPYLKPGAVIIAFFLAALFFVHTLFVQHTQLKQYESEMQELNAQIAQENAELVRIQEELEKRNTDEYIEKRARDLGFVKPDERVFIDVSGN